MYVKHSKEYRFYVIESLESMFVNTIIESRDDIFDEDRFTSISRRRGMIDKSSNKNSTKYKDVSCGTDLIHDHLNEGT